MYPEENNMIVVPVTKRMEIIMSTVCLNSWININYKENGGKQAFLANKILQDRVSQYGEHDCSAKNKKNRDCYGYPSLSHFIDEL